MAKINILKNPKHFCETCNFKTNHKPDYKRHLDTTKHKKLNIENNVIESNLDNLELNTYNFICVKCNYKTNDKKDYDTHLKCKMHNKPTNKVTILIRNNQKVFQCCCGKEYKHQPSYSKHKHKCKKLNGVSENKSNESADNSTDNSMQTQKTLIMNIVQQTLDINNEYNRIKPLDNIIDKTKKVDTLTKINNENIEENQIKSNNIIVNNTVVESRVSDNYINATKLCIAGGTQINIWISLESTKELLKAFESNYGLSSNILLQTDDESTIKEDIWIHPDLAIQLGNWISHNIGIQICKWIRNLYSIDKFDSNVKLLQDKDSEIKLKDQKIKLLEDIYIKKRKRTNYPEENVIYIVTSEDNKRKRIYIIGKAQKLKNRLSSYNKIAEHEVVYYKECKNEEDMNIIELMVINKLKDCKEQANRDRFVLPIDKDISFFTNIIDKCILFFE